MKYAVLFLKLVFAVSIFAVPFFSQNVRGRISTYFGDSLDGAEVRFFPLEMRDGQYRASDKPAKSALTDKSGRYEVSGLAPGEYRVTASLPGFPISKVEKFYLWRQADRVLDLGLKIGITHGLELIEVHGTILDEKGASIPGATVTVTNAFDRTDSIQTLSNRNGIYKLEFIQPGQYTISVTAPGFQVSAASFLVDSRFGKVKRKLNLIMKRRTDKAPNGN